MSAEADFRGRVALVTGGGSGIGRDASLLFAERGASVVVVDRDASAADRVAAEIVRSGGDALAVPADIAREGDTVRMASQAVERFGRLDCLFANAGIHRTGSVVSISVESWDEVVGVNLRGSFLTSRACIPHMLANGSGAIVITSSDSVVQTAGDESAYTTSKHGLLGLARSIAVDFGPLGIRANVLVPGVTNTPGLARIFSSGGRSAETEIEHAAALSPLQRVGRPGEVAEVAVFMCSDRASFITGAAVVVDGGMTIAYPPS